MEKQKIVAVDLDGVLANTVAAKRSALSFTVGKRIDLKQAKNGSFKHLFGGHIYNSAMELLYTTDHFFDWVRPFENVGRVLRRFVREGYVLKIVSKAVGLTRERLKRWCDKYNIPVSRDNIFTGQRDKKPHYETADIVIEDTDTHLKPFENDPSKRLILYRDTEYAEGVTPSEHSFEEVHSWPQMWHLFFGEQAKITAAA